MLAEAVRCDEAPEEFELVLLKLRKDIASAAATLTTREARYLVDLYYQLQGYRIATANQVRSMAAADAESNGGAHEPHTLLGFFQEQMSTVEKQLQKVLDVWSLTFRESRWARSITGIGPVIAAGLKAHIDVTRSTSVSHLWSFAGLNPTKKWEKGQRRPWNAQLKTLAVYKAGESFVKFQNHKHDVYGRLFKQQKAVYAERNAAGLYRAGALEAAARVGKNTEAYKAYSQGILPPAHIHASARRWAVKLFLSHYWEVAYTCHTGNKPPVPYAIAHLGHVDLIPVPNWPMGE